MSVLDPLVELFLCAVGNFHICEQLGAKAQIGDLVIRSNIVDLANGTLVKDCVEGIGGVSGKEISSGWRTVTVENQRLATVQEAGEFGDDFCKMEVSGPCILNGGIYA